MPPCHSTAIRRFDRPCWCQIVRSQRVVDFWQHRSGEVKSPHLLTHLFNTVFVDRCGRFRLTALKRVLGFHRKDLSESFFREVVPSEAVSFGRRLKDQTP